MDVTYNDELVSIFQEMLPILEDLKKVAATIPEVVSGNDDTRTVFISIDRSARLVDVTLFPQWKDKMRPTALGQHLTQALERAYAKQLESLENVRPIQKSTRQASREQAISYLDEAIGPVLGGPPPAPNGTLDDAVEEVLQWHETLRAEETGVSPNASQPGSDHVTMTGTPPRISSFSIDAGWASSADSGLISREIMDCARTWQSPPQAIDLFKKLRAHIS